MTRALASLAALAALLTAAAASAQSTVTLFNRPLPAGTVVRGQSTMTQEGEVSTDDVALTLASAGRSVQLTTILESSPDGTVRDRAVVVADTTWERMADEPLSVRVGPLQGLPVLHTLGPDGHARRRADGWTPTPEQADALDSPSPRRDAELPRRAIRVGETVVVSRKTMAQAYGRIDPDMPAELTVRLDSVGTHDGHPAAFLTETVVVTVPVGDGFLVDMAMTGQIVRRLDLDLTVQTHWEGHTVAYDSEFEIATWTVLDETVTVVDPPPPAP